MYCGQIINYIEEVVEYSTNDKEIQDIWGKSRNRILNLDDYSGLK